MSQWSAESLVEYCTGDNDKYMKVQHKIVDAKALDLGVGF